MSSQCNTVLQTAELLEAILQQLDMRTLLTSAQLVNRQWHELITSSPALQQALFFMPVAGNSGPVRQNVLLAEVFPLWFRENVKQTSDSKLKWFTQPSFKRLPMAKKSRQHTFMYPNATWRRMLVQQPPALRLGCWERYHGMGGDSHSFHVHAFPKGIRMDSLYDVAQRWVAYTVSSFCVLWDPSVALLPGSSSYGRSMNSRRREELRTFTEKVDLLICCVMTVQCTGDSSEEGDKFAEDFTFPVKQPRDENDEECDKIWS
ncbi:hypothetical protein F5Y19DRAFT_53306 [Xylariaceae sp. FL1651]|nr:hypothetical protein F5Y19DRAFT_53306 [Xylariaceae sp. FL1651]